MDYDALRDASDDELQQEATPEGTVEEVQSKIKRDLWALERDRKRIENNIKALRISLANPETFIKMLDITAQVVQQITTQDLTTSNVTTAPYSGLEDADHQFFKDHSSKTIYGLHKKLMANPEINEGVTKLKEEGTLDIRKQRHKNKPSAYIDSLANHKLIADLAKRQKEADERLARLELAQQENNSKFEQIGAALILQNSKIEALAMLGISPKKIEAYKLHLAKPQLTRQELADELGKSKPTIIKWLQEVQEEIAKSA